MLILSYLHPELGTDPLNGTAIPVDPDNGYSHSTLNALEWNDPAEVESVRFYCTTANHARVIHFKSTNEVVRQIAVNGNQVANTKTIWTDAATTTEYSDHSGFLPMATDNGFGATDGFFTLFPFFANGNHHWGLDAQGRWECDDIAGNSPKFPGRGNGAETHHQVWIRLIPPVTDMPSPSPSDFPSAAPSVSPSTTPTVSAAPTSPTQSPTESMVPSASPTAGIYESCAHAKQQGSATGRTQICPLSEDSSKCPHIVYCDQDSGDGGWMLLYSYNHASGQTDPVNEANEAPLDPNNGYSHVTLETLGFGDPEEVESIRFFCNTSMHDRTIHFSSTSSVVKQIAFDGDQSANKAEAWSDEASTTLLTGHTANLPASTNSVLKLENGAFNILPFADFGTSYWAIGALGRWECDDYSSNFPDSALPTDAATFHKVWARHPPPITDAPSPSPTSSPSTTPTAAPSVAPSTTPTATVFESCAQAKVQGYPTGETHICPIDANPGKCPYVVYCDQEFDGGGNMLLYSYKHAAGQTDPANGNVIPLDPDDGYSNVNLEAVGFTNPDEIESVVFFCTTSKHSRTMHFRSTNPVVKQLAIDGNQNAGNSPDAWTDPSTTFTLEGHNANLPVATDSVLSVSDGAFRKLPFYKFGSHAWGIDALGSWNCDDVNDGSNGASTVHRVWVRHFAPETEAPTISPSAVPTRSPSASPTGNPTITPAPSSPTDSPTESDIAYGLQLSCNGVNPTRYNLCLDLASNISSSMQPWMNVVGEAKEKIESVITGDLPDFPIRNFWNDRGRVPQELLDLSCSGLYPDTIDDTYVCIKDIPMDGPGVVLGEAGPIVTRELEELNPLTNQPYVVTLIGQISFNTLAIPPSSQVFVMFDFFFRSLLKVVGIGELWEDNGVYNNATSFYASGTNAVAKWNEIGCSGPLPVDSDGTQWKDACLGDEIMTSQGTPARERLSKITVGSLADMGYTVDYDAADPFSRANLGNDCGISCPSFRRQLSEGPKHRKLSKEGLVSAQKYAKRALSARQLNEDIRASLPEGVRYVGGDRMHVIVKEGDSLHLVPMAWEELKDLDV